MYNKCDFDEYDNLEVPTEDSTNSMTKFSSQSSKLLDDKGNVKTEDIHEFSITGGRLYEFIHIVATSLYSLLKYDIFRRDTHSDRLSIYMICCITLKYTKFASFVI